MAEGSSTSFHVQGASPHTGVCDDTFCSALVFCVELTNEKHLRQSDKKVGEGESRKRETGRDGSETSSVVKWAMRRSEAA